MRPEASLLAVRLAAGYPAAPAVLRDVRFRIAPGEILGLVGQSGSGKSTLALAILALLRLKGGTARGEVLFRGRNLLELPEAAMRRIRGREIGLVFQSPCSALNPVLRIGTQLAEAWRAHGDARGRAAEEHLLATLAGVTLPADRAFLRRYPRELSVGQAQRVLIGLAILHRPSLLIADEATSALDAITQREVLALVARLSRERGMAVLYISHDLLSVASLCGRVAILHEGEVVESGPVRAIFEHPAHPYTRRLVAALPAAPAGLFRAGQIVIRSATTPLTREPAAEPDAPHAAATGVSAGGAWPSPCLTAPGGTR